MKKKTGKMILLTGVLCILSLAVCACGKTEEPQAIQGEPTSEYDTKNDSTPEPSVETEDESSGDKRESAEAETVPESGENSNQGTDSAQKEQSEAQSASDAPVQWVDSTPNLEGEAKDLKDGQLTVVEYVTEKADDGGDIMAAPADGDDSEFNKITVTYDENTLFAIQTIYDGGSRAEMSAATAADLAAGQSIRVWGSLSGSSLKATQICIVKVA